MKYLLFFWTLLLFYHCTPNNVSHSPEKSSREYYQIKEYTFSSLDQMDITDQYLQNAYMPALKRQGIDQIGVFTSIQSYSDSTWSTYVLTPYSSLEQIVMIDDQLLSDETYLTDGATYINATHNNPPYDRIETTLLRAFSDMPFMATPKLEGLKEDRIYELRSYESATEAIYRNKVDMFNAGGEIVLFDRLQFNALFYGEVLSGSKMPNLMYMTTHADSISRATNWKNFVDSPEWKELVAMDKYKNNISHMDIYLLSAATYSDY